MPWKLVCGILAILLFLFAAFGGTVRNIQLGWLGLAFLAVALMF